MEASQAITFNLYVLKSTSRSLEAAQSSCVRLDSTRSEEHVVGNREPKRAESDTVDEDNMPLKF